MTKICTKIE